MRLSKSIALLLVSTASAQAPRQHAAPARHAHPSSPDQQTLTKVTRVRVPSRVFHTTRDIYVWEPEAEGITAPRYPVLVFPDAEETGQFRSALANIQFLINRQLIPPMLVVGVPYLSNRRHELTPAATGETARMYPAAGGADDNLRFMAEELLPWIDARYPTVPTRILVGHSLGGLFALYAMGARPDLFRVVVALSPPIWWNDGALSSDLAARIAGDTVRPRTLFLASGGLEPAIDTVTSSFAARLQRIRDSIGGGHLRFERKRYPRDIHEMVTLPGLVDGLRMAFEPMFVPTDSLIDAIQARPERDSAEVHGMARQLEARYANAAAALGVPALFPEAPLNLLGRYALQLHLPQLAATLLRENASRYPYSSGAHETLAESLEAAGDTAQAITELRTALGIARDSLRTTSSVISRTRENGVAAAAERHLQALRGASPRGR